jgi:uncharacterized integral membrane protein
MRFLKVIISTVIILLGFVFIIENLDMLKHAVKMKLDLYFFTFESPDIQLWVIILFTFFLGVFTASLYGFYELIKQRRTIRTLNRNLEVLAHELKVVSAMPGGSATTPDHPAPPRAEG